MLKKIKNEIRQLKTMRSLKTRIFVIILIVGTVPSIVMRYGIVQNYEDRAISQRTTTVQTQMRVLANHLITYNYLQDNSSHVVNAELDLFADIYDGRVLIIGSNFKVAKDTYGISEGKTIISEEVIRCFKGENPWNYDRENGYIEMTMPIVDNSAQNTAAEEAVEKMNPVLGAMLISISTDSIRSTMDILNRKAFILEALMMMVIFAVAAGLSIVLVRPFHHVTDAMNKVKEGFGDEAISVPDYVETTDIINSFNQILGRMKVLDDSRQEFVANVSHELKTPLASMKVLADSLLAQADTPPELYREFLTDIGAEIDRENQIITDLLALVKMDKTVTDLNISIVDINELTELILKRLRPIARKKDVEVVFESIRPVTAEVDEVKITLIMSNLVENAIKYNKEHGRVKVVLDADHQFFTFEVSDSGLGIPEEDLEHIYERFYRVDKSHSREIGGTGLGLAITRSAVIKHRGSIKVTSVENEGTVFVVKIPLNYISS